MSQWTGDVQARLDNGESLTVCSAVHVKAKSFATGLVEPIGFWMGSETLTLTLEGEGRTYLGAGDLLNIDAIEIRADLNVHGNRVSISGINETIDLLQREYDLNSAPLDTHDLAFTAGFGFVGSRRTFVGFVDGAPNQIDDMQGDYSLIGVSRLRYGTRTLDAMLNASRDPFFKYAAGTEGDAWG